MGGETFLLTQGVDNIQGTNGDDTIIAGPGSAGGAHTLGASDVINGGGGNDKIIITSQATAVGGENLVPRMTSVEQVFIQAVGTTGTTVNMINATGSKEVWSDNSTDNVFVTNLQEKATIGVKGGNGGNVMVVQAAAPALTGDLAVALNGANAAVLAVNATGLAGAAGYTSTTINTTVGNNAITGLAGTQTSQLGVLDVGNALNKVTVTGDGAVRVINDLAATVRTIDASANKGGVNFNIANNTGNVTFTGGDGNDRINFGGTLNLQDKVDGGAGRDILGVTDQSFIIPGLQVSNVEVLELNTLNGTLNAALIAGVDEVRVTTTLNNGVVNGLTSNSTFVTNAAGTATLNLVNAQVAGTNDTLNLKTGIAGGTPNAPTMLSVMAAGVENIVYTQNNAANAGASTSVGFFDTDGQVDVTSLTINNNAGNNAYVDWLTNTIKTVDASAAQGNVRVSISTGNATNGVTIKGGAGNDLLIGGDGKDVINGGAGNDVISGDAYTFVAGTGGAAVKQVSTITISTAEVGDTFTIGGQNVVWTGVAATDNANVISAINATVSGSTPSSVVASGAGVYTITGATNGAAFSLPSVSATNLAAAPEVSTVTVNNASAYDNGDVVRVTVNGANYDYAVTANGTTAAAVAAGLQTLINGGGQMTAAATGNVLTLTGVTTSNYTISSSITNAGTNVALVPSVLTITPNDLEAGEALTVTLGGTAYSIAFNTTVGQTLTDFVAANGAAINGATGGTLAVSGSTLTVTQAAGTGLNITTGSGAITGGDGGTVTVGYVAGNPGYAITANAAPTVADNAPAAAGANTQTIVTATPTAGQMSNDQYFGGTAAADILTGGEGSDTFYFFSGSNGFTGTAFTTMDTITDLNLGGAGQSVGVDRIVLSANTFNAFAPTDLINGGTAVTMTGPTLASAYQALFNAGGALNGSVNDVGLFTYGGDTYLIATDGNSATNTGDVIIKVTGVVGTLDISDIVVM